GLLSLVTLVEVEPFQPMELDLVADLDLSTGSAGGIVEWPTHKSIKIGSTDLLESLSNTFVTDVTLSTKTRCCVIDLLGIRICLGRIRDNSLPINLDKLVPGTSTLLQTLTSALDDTLFPLFDAL